MPDSAQCITDTLTRLQKEFKCGICCSTFKDPILSTCHHIFCRACINICFEKKRKVQCPICRSVLDRRSCRDSYQVTMAVQNYLKLSEAFKKDIENMPIFTALPPEKKFEESQVPLDITIIPENDGKRCAPEFAIPMLPVRRKRTSKPASDVASDVTSTIASEASTLAEEKVKNQTLPVQKQQQVSRPVEELQPKKNVGTLTDNYTFSLSELQNVDIQDAVNKTRENAAKVHDIDALFMLIPSIIPFLRKNIHLLNERFNLETTENLKESIEKPDRRVSFANSQILEHFITGEESVDAPVVTGETLIASKKETKLPEVPKISSKSEETTRADEDDEVVEDSEEEAQEMEDVTNVTNATQSTLLDADRTDKAIENEEERIDKELSQVPKYIVCSRIHNDEDEVELLSDFYHKFLSNACRFSEEVNAHTTHLVMMNSERRTIPQKSTAYLQAIARKCVIVGRQWLVDCLKTGLLLSEADYTITKCTSLLTAGIISKSGSEIGWLRSRNDESVKLFDGCRFMILRKFSMNPYFDYKQLIDLVQLCGGEILSDYQNLSPENLYIIFSKDSKAIGESQNMENLYKCNVVTMEWVLDSISEYCLLPTTNYKAVDEIAQA